MSNAYLFSIMIGVWAGVGILWRISAELRKGKGEAEDEG